MSIIIGLDISLNSPGWCRIDTDNGARTFDTLDFSKLKDMERISTGAKTIVELCRHADLVIMEGLSMAMPSRGGMTFVPQGRYDLVGLVYIVRLWLFNTRRKTLVVPPSTLKKFVTGKGNGQKNLMLREVSHRWGVEAADDNQADAVALAEFGRAYLYADDMDLPEFQKVCLPKAAKLFDDAA